VAQLEPKEPAPHYLLAYSLLNLRDYAAAEREARIATELDPKHLLSWVLLHDALEALGRLEEARAAEERFRALGGKLADDPDGGVAGH
jgi:Flp pilus assembly protein TadD